MLTWRQRYHVKRFLQWSFWLPPVGAVVLAMVLRRLMEIFVDDSIGLGILDFTAEGARAEVSSLSTSMLTFLVFVLSSLLLIVQLASSQLTPRVIALAFRNNSAKILVSVLLFSYVYTTGVLARIEADRVHQLSVLIAVASAMAGIVLFIWFAAKLGLSCRPISLLLRVYAEAEKVINEVYPNQFDAVEPERPYAQALPAAAGVVKYIGNSGVFLGYGKRALERQAEAAGCAVELVVQVGDFITPGDALFRVYPAEAPIAKAALLAAVAVGPERTMPQDPAFAFRIMVDIALRALSPAVNDPNTAVLALDQIHRLLRVVGLRRLDSGHSYDRSGTLRLIVPTPNWEDFVPLALTEIRLVGANSLQVVRRLRAVLEHLIEILPASRVPILRDELALLDEAVSKHYPAAGDRRLAMVADRQGLGGSATLNRESIAAERNPVTAAAAETAEWAGSEEAAASPAQLPSRP
jgi:uncharacterized membrane protein